MRGVILAGGSGSRMKPATEVCTKAMQTVYDRPAIEYPLRTLKEMSCDEALIVGSPRSVGEIAGYFKDGDRVGINLTYRVQPEPRGVADALGRAENYVNGLFPLLLGDVYFDPAPRMQHYTTLFYHQYEFANQHSVWNKEADIIVEKPRYINLGHKAIVAYYYDESVFEFINQMTPAQSGELEIVDLHNYYRERHASMVEYRGFFGDMGTPDGLLRVAKHIHENKLRS